MPASTTATHFSMHGAVPNGPRRTASRTRRTRRMRAPTASLRWNGRHDRAACLAGAVLDARKEARENLRQLSHDVVDRHALQIQARSTAFAVPREAVLFVRAAPPLHDDADAAGRALGRVRNVRREQEYLARPDRHVDHAIRLNGA